MREPAPTLYGRRGAAESFLLLNALSKQSGVKPRRNRSDGENVVPTGGGDFNRSFHMLLGFHLAEIQFLFAGSCLGPTVGRAVERTGSREISPRRKCTTSESELAPYTSTPSTTAASAALSAGTMRVCRCRRLASKRSE